MVAAQMEESKEPRRSKQAKYSENEESKESRQSWQQQPAKNEEVQTIDQQFEMIDSMDFEGDDFCREQSINFNDYSIMLEHKKSKNKQNSEKGDS